jgi:hypothetical protein
LETGGRRDLLAGAASRYSKPDLRDPGAARGPYHHVGTRRREDFWDGASRDRTGDLLLAKQALSHLSYGPAGASSLAASVQPSVQQEGQILKIGMGAVDTSTA